jgi:dienelactone hydrolase
MSHTFNSPARNLSVDQLPKTEQTGSIAYVNDARGALKYYVDNQSIAYHKDGKWLKFEDNIEVIPNAPSLWNTEDGVFNNWNPDSGSFNLSAISINDSSNNYGGTGDGIYRWKGFIDMPIYGNTIKIFFSYQIKNSLRGGTPVPAIIQSHGWSGSYSDYSASSDYLSNDFAVISYDWRGTYNGTYSYPTTLMTIYPQALSALNQVTNPNADERQSTVTSISSVREMDMYYWSAIPRRLLSYVRTISDINPNKIGFSGYSWGGTLAWNMCIDTRLKAIVSYYGVGWITYWRGNPKYIIPYSESTYSDEINRYISALECQSHAKRAKVPVLWLTGTNEYHGQLDRGQDSFDLLPTEIYGSFAFEANQAHNPQVNTGQDEILWFKKYLKGENITWYDYVTPVPSLVTSAYPTSGYPMITITPKASANVVSLSGWYANYNPDQTTRLWLSGNVVNNGNGTWSFEMPSDDVNKWMHGYGIIKYDNNVTICTKVATFIPVELGNARTREGAYFDPLKANSSILNLWLDANDANTFTLGSNNKVAQWNDKSSFGTHAINNTDASRPTLSAISSGINAVVCRGSALNGSTGLFSNTTNTSGSYRDLFIVATYDNGATWSKTDGIDYVTLFSGGVNLGPTSNGIVGSPNTNFCPLSTEFWTSSWIQNSDYHLNGSLTPTVSSGTETARIALPTIYNNPGIINFRYTTGSLILSGYTISGLKGAISNSWNGKIYEIVSYQSLLNTAERQKVEGYLAYKWGLQNLLPPSHPYKNTRPPA